MQAGWQKRERDGFAAESRREKVGLCIARGMRSSVKIAEALNCHQYTVRRDMAILRNRRRKSKSYEEQQEIALLESVRGLLADIEELDELITQAKKDKNIELEHHAEGETSDQIKRSAVTKVKKTTKGINYNAIANLYQLKLKARREVCELYDLLEPESKKNLFRDVNIIQNNTTINVANKTINLEAISDADLIAATKSFEGGATEAVQTPPV